LTFWTFGSLFQKGSDPGPHNQISPLFCQNSH